MNGSINNPARDGQVGLAEDRLLEVQEELVDAIDDVESGDAVLGEVLDEDGRPIGASLEVRLDPVDRDRASSIAEAADVSVLEVESIRSLDRSRPGRVAYTADLVRVTYGVIVDV